MNELFCGILRGNKTLGLGMTKSKLNKYFEAKMRSKPDTQILQYMLLFYIIYYTGRRGRENLHRIKKNSFAVSKDPDGRCFIYQAVHKCDKNHMLLFYIIYYTGRRGRENLHRIKKNSFAVSKDPDGRCFIYQAVHKCDKNHNEKDMTETNKARIHQIPGNMLKILRIEQFHNVNQNYNKK